ncbi:hypothetical protein K460DRAFT_297792, partial [Cucurbitaria berberidis CBS 394.84]
NCCEPLLEFPLALPYLSIVHYLLSPNSYALTQIYLKTLELVNNVRLLSLCFKTGCL